MSSPIPLPPKSPKASSPKASSPKAGSPKAGSPKAGSPKAGSPKASSPKASSPKAGSPKASSPKASSLKAGSPKASSLKAGLPKPYSGLGEKTTFWPALLTYENKSRGEKIGYIVQSKEEFIQKVAATTEFALSERYGYSSSDVANVLRAEYRDVGEKSLYGEFYEANIELSEPIIITTHEDHGEEYTLIPIHLFYRPEGIDLNHGFDSYYGLNFNYYQEFAYNQAHPQEETEF